MENQESIFKAMDQLIAVYGFAIVMGLAAVVRVVVVNV